MQFASNPNGRLYVMSRQENRFVSDPCPLLFALLTPVIA